MSDNLRKCIGAFVQMIVFIVTIIIFTVWGDALFVNGLGWAIIYLIIIFVVIQIVTALMIWVFTRGLPENGGRRAE